MFYRTGRCVTSTRNSRRPCCRRPCCLTSTRIVQYTHIRLIIRFWTTERPFRIFISCFVVRRHKGCKIGERGESAGVVSFRNGRTGLRNGEELCDGSRIGSGFPAFISGGSSSLGWSLEEDEEGRLRLLLPLPPPLVPRHLL